MSSIMKMADVISVFVAAPSDVTDEIDSVHRASQIVHEGFAAMGRDVLLKVTRWTDVSPGLHDKGPQGKIEEDLNPYDQDVFIAIFKKKFGKPRREDRWTPTEREVRLGIRDWETHGRPRVAIYFSRNRSPDSEQEGKQVCRLLKFRAELEARMLTAEFEDPHDLTFQLISNLFKDCARILSGVQTVNKLQINARADAVPFRASGVTEAAPTVWLEIDRPDATTGVQECTISVWSNPSVNFTGRDLGEGLTDCWLTPTPTAGGELQENRRRGKQVANNRIEFSGVRLDGRQSGFSLEGVRINASQLGVVQDGSCIGLGITVVLGRDSSQTATAYVEVGYVYRSHRILVETNGPAPRASSIREAGSTLSVGDEPFLCLIHFEETVPGTFRSRVDESCSGSTGLIGGADSGTRFRVVVAGTPPGSIVYASPTDIHGKGWPVLAHGMRAAVTPTDANGAGEALLLPIKEAAQLIPIPGLGGTHQCIWECLSAPGARPQVFTFGILIASPHRGHWPITVSASLAPVMVIAKASGSASVPRFVDDFARWDIQVDFSGHDG